MTKIHYQTVDIDGIGIFYRQAGTPGSPKLLLLHGFPTSSHMFRDLIPLLADRFEIFAPDLPSFGQSDMPPRERFTYTFESITDVIEKFTEAIGLDRYAVYVFDYGAPVGYRLALSHPERIAAIISQNGNAYDAGLSEAWSNLRAYWADPSQNNRDGVRYFLSLESIRDQYIVGVADPSLVSPDGYTADYASMSRPGADEVQLDLLGDYRTNVALYPQFQAYFRQHQPPLLAVWGQNDPFFTPAGANAYTRDLPDAVIKLLDTGHFALATHATEIANEIHEFLASADKI
jgi:pimeloyl-ACP methyl ester carboxylesterase